VLYGTFITVTTLALILPVLQMQFTAVVTYLFTKGELADLGNAYLAGDILSATWHTWVNNYLDQTVKMTLLPALAPFLGTAWACFKTLASVALAGFVLGPTGVEVLHTYTYHSITVVLEVEAYCVAAFAALLFPLYLIEGGSRGDLVAALKQSAIMFRDAVVLTGAMLLIAAFYESVSLILIAT